MTPENEQFEPGNAESLPRARRHTPEEVEAILARQGPKKYATAEALLGAGKNLWDSDEELDEFLRGIHERRKQKE
jgi:hypothetical protein